MVKEIVFHIGDPKTGTTSIQKTLATRSWKCDGVDLLYSAPVNHLPLAEVLRPKAPEANRPVPWIRLKKAIEGSSADTAVVSAESFEWVAPEVLAKAINEFLPGREGSVRLIAYVRPNADRLVSAYAERVKQGVITGTLDEFHEFTKKSQQFLYAPRFRRWRAVFGDRLTVRPMIRSRLKDGDVVHDFMDFVFRGRPFELLSAPTSNESLTLEDLAMLHEFHLIAGNKPALRKAKRSFGWNFAAHLSGLAGAGGTKPRLHRDLVPDVVETYRADAEAMDAEFFGGEPTLLPALLEAEDKAVDTAQSIDAEDHFEPDALRMIRVWAELAAEMLEHRPDIVAEHFRQRQRVAFAHLRGDSDADEFGPPIVAARRNTTLKAGGRKRRKLKSGNRQQG